MSSMKFKDRCELAVACLPDAPYKTALDTLLGEMLAVIDTQSQSVPAGYVLVPIEPTEAMRKAAHQLPDQMDIGDEYRAMLAAAPQPVQLLTGLILPKHRCPLTGAGIPDPTTFGEKQ